MNHLHHQSQYQFAPAPTIASMPTAPQHHHHHYTPPRPTTARVSSSTTEFRGSTNPDEDWTKISDLAERRRIQNRIAQRNYRKKLKRRLEDLERRAASRSLSPNGEDTDGGRSTRESSAEHPLHSPPPSSDPSHSPPPPSYTTSSSSSSASYYRTAPAFSAAPDSSNYYYAPPQLPALSSSSSASSPSVSPLYSYSHPTLSSVVEATCGSGGEAATAPPPSSASYLPLPSARLSSYAAEHPKYEENTMSPFYMSYAGLAESPDPSYFSHNYYHGASQETAIKQEH